MRNLGFNEAALGETKTVILCEALIDALSFVRRGYTNVTSAYGVEGFTEEVLACFQRKGIERVLIAYDRDEAGEKAALDLGKLLIGEGLECYRVQFPQGMDANEYMLKESERGFDQVLTRAELLGKGASALQREATKRAQAWAAEQRAAAEPTVSPLAAEVASAIAPTPAAAPSASEAPLPLPALVEVPQVSQQTAAVAVEASPAPIAVSPSVPAPPSPITTKATTPAALEGREDEVVLHFGDRRYRVRGLSKNTSFDALKVNLLVARGDTFHVDTLDLYSAKARSAFVAQALTELRLDADVLKHDLGQLLLKLEGLHEESVRKLLEPKQKAVTPPRGQQRRWKRFQVHYTPKHGSWLNIAETEVSLWSRECHGRHRISTFHALASETRTWNRRANRLGRKVIWTFNVRAARKKFKLSGR